MEPKYITFEQAKWLKEKGFDVPVKSMYHDEEFIYGGADYNHNNKEEQKLWNCLKLSAPEQYQVVDWLLEKHNLWVHCTKDGGWWFPIIENYYDENNQGTIIEDLSKMKKGYFNSPQEAYSAVFDYILNNNLI
jgi:hypothetical protein